MNGYMNISVRVISSQATAQIRALQAQLRSLQGGTAAAGSAFESMLGARALSPMVKLGNQLQWTGRQLQYNFTLPILLAGAAATKFALQNEQAFVKMVKVYGDVTMSQQQVTNETNALRKAFVALSNHFGVAQKDVLDVAAAWAAAGASGLALAQDVKLTMETMILGEMNATEATQALIAIQAQYNQSTSELAKTIQILNMVENQTGISLQGLVQGFARAAGTAAMAGIDVRHLAALLAAMTPAAGSAAQAGNALKTIISRLFAPTKDAVDVMGKMGIKVNSVAWQSKNGSQRLEELAGRFEKLNGAQKSAVSSIIASRFQLNKFGVLMDSIAASVNKATNQTSYYQRALESTASDQAVFNQMQKELNQVLSSNPQRLKQIWTILQNAMADIIQPMIPVILLAADVLRRMAQAFSNLPPEVQKLITVGLLFLALFGPLLRYLGSTITLLYELRAAFGWVLVPVKLLIGGVSSLAGTIAGPVVGAFGILGGVLAGAWNVFMGTIGWVGKMLASFVQFFLFVAGTPLKTLGPILFQGFAMIGRNLAVIWTGTWTAIRAITLTGASWIGDAILIVFGQNLMASFRAIWVGLVAISAAGMRAMLISFRQFGTVLVTMSAATFTNMRALFIGGWAALVGTTRTSIMVIFAMVRSLPMMLLKSGPALFAALRVLGTGAIAALTGPWGIAISIVIGIILLFRKQLVQIFHNIIGDFNQLPAGVANAFRAVVNIVKQAALTVYSWLQWINPFARHSPSLVDNVTKGMAIVRAELASVTGAVGPIQRASRDLQTFGKVIAALKAQMASAQAAQDRANIGKVNPGAVRAFDVLTADLALLNRALAASKAQVDAQQRVVDAWSQRLDAANAALSAQKDKLDALQAVLNKYQDNLSAAKDRLQTFANTPIKGMKAMSDQIFANEMAQKKLRLEMLKIEDVTGPIDQVRSRLDKLNGEMELAQGTANALRAKGAGSDILSAYNDQIKAIDDQKKAITQTLKPYDDLSKALDDLQRKGEILDLTNSLQFDPLTRQIDQAANAMKELPFDQIMTGIQGAKADMDRWQQAVDQATKAVEAQQKVVDASQAAHDAIQKRYDAENASLQKMKDNYNAIADAISSVKDALSGMTQAANDALQKQAAVSPAMQAFNAGALAKDFPGVTGSGGLGRQGGAGDQSALIDQFTRDMAKSTSDMFAKFDMFGPIKRKWNQFTAWLRGAIAPVKAWLDKAFAGVDFSAPFKGMNFDWLGKVKDFVVNAIQTIVDWGGKLWKLFGPDLIAFGKNLWAGIQSIWAQVQPELAKFGELVKPVWQAIQNAWSIIKPILGVIIGIILGLASVLLHTLASVIKPVFQAIGGILAGFLETVRGIIRVITFIFTGDWDQLWKGVQEIFGGVWKMISSLFMGIVNVIVGLVKGLVTGIWNFFKWLWDVLVGHSIIPDIINGIWNWFKKLIALPLWIYNNMLKPIFDKISSWWTANVSPKIAAIVSGIHTFFHGLGSLPKWLLDNAFTPIYSRLNDVWTKYIKPLGNTMLRGFASIFNNIGKAIAMGINGGIGAINKLIDGLNWIGSHVPGLSFKISTIGTFQPIFWTPPQFASGGSIPGLPKSRVGAGFKTHGIRAIVGEGNPAHPEFVIPTDPKYRKRAIGLLGQAAQEVGIGFASGGILGEITKAVISSGADIARGAVNKVMDPIVGTVNGMLDRLDNRMYLRDFLKATVRTVATFGKAVDNALPKADGGFNPRLTPALNWAKSQAGLPYVWGSVGPGGYDCSGFMSAVTNYVLGAPLHQRRFATGNFPTGDWVKGPGAFMIGSFRGNPGHMAGTMNGTNIESSGGIGVHYGPSARGARDPLFGGNIWHLKGYAAGGRIGDPAFDLLSPRGNFYMGNVFRRLVRRQTFDVGGMLQPGYTLAYNGTGRPERVLTSKQSESVGKKEIHFYGDLSFPNITSGDDAEKFIRNLEVLTGGR